MALLTVMTPESARAQPAPDLQETIARYQQLAHDLSVTIAQTEIIQRQIGDLAHQMRSRRAAIGQVASSSYRNRRADSLLVLVDASSTNDVLERLLLLNGYARKQQHEIDALAWESGRYEAARRTLDSLITQQRRQQQVLALLRDRIQDTQAKTSR